MFTDHFKINHRSELYATILVPAGILWRFSLLIFSESGTRRQDDVCKRDSSLCERKAKRQSADHPLLPSQSSAFSNSSSVDFGLTVNQIVAAIQEEHCRSFDLLPCYVLPVQ